MPIALRLNIADKAFPTSQWTEAGATRIAPRVSRIRPDFSGCSPTTAKIADVSITISINVNYTTCTIVQQQFEVGIGTAITTVAGIWNGTRPTPLWTERSRVLELGR